MDLQENKPKSQGLETALNVSRHADKHTTCPLVKQIVSYSLTQFTEGGCRTSAVNSSKIRNLQFLSIANERLPILQIQLLKS